MSDEQIKSLWKAITRQHAVAEQLAARVMQMDEVNAELLEFAQEVRRAGDTLLANMAIAAIAIAKLAIETPAEVSPARAAPASTLKPHVFRELVNDLRDLAKEFHGHDSLRDRISGRLGRDVPVVGPCQGHAAQQDADALLARIARAIWGLRREEEDRCDMELEDMPHDHSVWQEAKAAIEAMKGGS